MHVIRATTHHLPALAELFHQYRAFYGQPRDDARVEAFLRDRLERGDSVVLLAVDDGGAARTSDDDRGAERGAGGDGGVGEAAAAGAGWGPPAAGTAEVMGFAQLYPTFSSIRLRRAWILNDLFTAPAHRRRGVARALIDGVLRVARESGAALVELATAESNASARALYESAGFRLDEFLHYYLELPDVR